MTHRPWLVAVGFLLAVPTAAQPPLPTPLSNNTVAAGVIDARWWVFTALGIDSSKRWSGIVRSAMAWTPGRATWDRLPDVPGPVGRLAATAQVVRGRLLVFGGYTVDSAGNERSVPDVNIYDPNLRRWVAGAPTPVAVDDAVSGVWKDSLVYLVSGWHDTDNVQRVQVYDVERDEWHQATPIPGPGVFGHTGVMVGAILLYIDGAARQAGPVRYGLVPQSWMGTIDPANPLRIRWRRLEQHPGAPRYRAAAGTCGPWVVIAGGTANPYNYNGIGYNGTPSAPIAEVLALDTRTGSWTTWPASPRATMDHRSLVVARDSAFIVGGMHDRQTVSAATVAWPLRPCSNGLPLRAPP